MHVLAVVAQLRCLGKGPLTLAVKDISGPGEASRKQPSDLSVIRPGQWPLNWASSEQSKHLNMLL